MDMSEADPYEHQLRALFESFDSDNLGSLNRRGLQQLCEQLPLDSTQSEELISALLPNDLARISFIQFWNGLLTLLGGEKSTSSVHGTSEKAKDKDELTVRGESPEREVSPKLVLGQKKYGRRSRPESSELEFDPSETDSIRNPQTEKADSTASTSSDIDEEDHDTASSVKKRRTAENLTTNLQGSLSQAEDCLKVAWQQYGKNGFVSQLELGQVCECIGIEKFSNEALQQLFEQLDTDRDGKVSLDDFLLLFRSGVPCATMTQSSSQGTWVLGSNSLSGGASLSLTDFNGAGMASAESITEMWESVGVSNPSLLLRDLNLDDSLRSLNVASVASAIEEEVARQGKTNSGLDGSVALTQGPTAFANNLLLAALSLRQAEVRWIRSSLEQMSCERDKLRNDLAEANYRASLLAQEIDDHHSKLEKVSQNQFKLLEQKHSEVIRDLTARFSQEREQQAQQSNRLEQKVSALLQSESKLSSEAASLRLENETLDQESRNLTERLAECEEAKLQMGKELQEIEHLQQRLHELQANQDEDRIEHLCEQITKLRSENSCLRDRNDELTVELEVLTTRLSLSNVRVRRQAPTSVDGNLTGGTKRRGNSPLAVAPADDSGEEESPRVGKVRRCSQKGDISLDNVHIEGLQIHPMATNERGVETDVDLDSSENHFGRLSGSIHLGTDQWLNLKSESSSLAGSQDDLASLTKRDDEVEVARLQARIRELERALAIQLQTNNSVGSLETKRSDLQGLKEIEEDSIVYLSNEDTPTTSFNERRTPTCDDFEATVSPSTEKAPTADNPAVEQLQQHCKVLENQLDNVKVQIVKILSEKRACSEENCVLKKRVFELSNQLPVSGSENHPSREDVSEVDFCMNTTVMQVHSASVESCIPSRDDKCIGTSGEDGSVSTGTVEDSRTAEANQLEISSLRDRCSDLEKSLSMMRDEYERCEDYWAGKLDEERQLAEQEQQITDEKFSELMSKIREYEDLFADDHMRRTGKSMDGRLETIEEQDGLEKQVTQLEEELEEIRCQGEAKLVEKETEIKKLRDQLRQLQLCHMPQPQAVCSQEIAVQVSDLETRSWGSDRTFIVKPRIVIEKDAPSLPVLNGNTTDNALTSTASSPSSPSSCDSPVCSEEDARCKRSHQSHGPHGRHRRMRHHPPYIALNCLNPEDELQAVGLRLREQEQTCVRLQRALRVQQQQTQALLQHTWDRHKQEVADLQIVLQCTQEKLEQQGDVCREQMNRLTRSDMLVKELYVENAHLLASIQNLEERCLLLLQQQASIGSRENCSSV